MRCSQSRSPTSAINRYYDPTTDQFLSVDPLVDETGQPYVFTNDNPLNATDPVGQTWDSMGPEGNPGLYEAPGLAAYESTIEAGVESDLAGVAEEQVPGAAKETLKYVEDNGGKPPPGYKGGRTSQNREGRLPTYDSTGRPITYKEYDIKSGNAGARSGERIVIGSDSRAYYTSNHYTTFVPIKK